MPARLAPPASPLDEPATQSPRAGRRYPCAPVESVQLASANWVLRTIHAEVLPILRYAPLALLPISESGRVSIVRAFDAYANLAPSRKSRSARKQSGRSPSETRGRRSRRT